MHPVVIACIANVEMPHEFLQIAPRGLHQQLEMIFHKNIGQNFNLVGLLGFFQKTEEGRTVAIPRKDSLPAISPTGNVVTGILILNSQRSCHGSLLSHPLLLCQE